MRTRGNNGIVGSAITPGSNGAGVISATDAAQAWLGGAWPGSTSKNVIYGPGLGNTTISNVVVTDSNFNNTFGAIATTNSYIKIFGTGFVSNTTVLVNANSVPVTGVTFASSEELRVALPTIANNQTVQFNVTNAGAPKFTAVYTQVTVDYLIVAGGGSGASSPPVGSGGGGAGGLLTGTQTLITGTTYPVVVGSGGFSAASMAGSEKSGNNSTALGLTAIGGGSGGRGCACSQQTGGSGGGGGSYTGAGKVGALATGSPGVGIAGTQGFPGGTGAPVAGPGLPSPAAARAGGGGGAGGAGTQTSGGAGYLWPFTGDIYAAGGGGSYGGGTGSPGGSSCVGGNGAFPSANGQGRVFTGSGGGGSSGGARNTSGGPGVVIIAAPTAFYPKISVPAGLISSGNVVVTTPAAAPGSTVITFRGSGSFSVLS